MIGQCLHQFFCRSVHVPFKTPMPYWGYPLKTDVNCLITNNSAAHANYVGWCDVISRKRKSYENLLPIKSKMADSGLKCDFLALSLNYSQLCAALVSIRSKVSEVFSNLACTDDRTMFSPNLVQIGPRPLQHTYVVFGAPLKFDEKVIVNHQ